MILRRFYTTDLKSTLKNVIPKKLELFQHIKHTKNNVKLGDLTVGNTIGGMRGYNALLWDSSKVDPEKGVTFHGHTIKECKSFLPKQNDEKNDDKSEFLPESMFWYLLTGEIPSQDQINSFSSDLVANSKLPGYLIKVLDSLPSKSLHPMTQLSIAISSLNNESKFAKAYERGVSKSDYWEYTFDDSLNLLSKLPAIIGKIYSNSYHNGEILGEINYNKDWSYNLSSLLGQTSKDSKNLNGLSNQQSTDFVNLVRLYCALHGDHEGGNVSSHTSHLVGSALSDPFLSYSAGIQGLAGPLHGLAAQEVVRFIIEMKQNLKDISNDEEIKNYLWSILNAKRVIPGYGHGVLRKPDPRFEAMIQFGENRPEEFINDENFQLVKKLSQIAPDVLKTHGKTKNPYPNVDSSSGVLFYHYGIKELLFFTVIFGGSRALGPLSQLIWDRIYGLPIERPKSIDLLTLSRL